MKLNKKVVVQILFVVFILPVQADILLIESYHAQYPWDMSYKVGLDSVLGQRYLIRNFEMDTKRLPVSEYQNRADAAWSYYHKLRPELVILADDNALRLLGPRFAKTDTPVVYLGINGNPRNYGLADAANITGVLERPRLADAIFLLGKLLSNPSPKVLVLLDSGVTSKVILEDVFNSKDNPINGRMQIVVRQIDLWKDWQSEVLNARKNGYSAIIAGLYHTIKTSNGDNVDSELIIRWTSANTPVPPFAFWDFAVGEDKAIGGIVLFGKAQGEAAAHIALKILSGTSPSTILPKTAEEGRYLFSPAQLAKWKLDKHPFILKRAEYVN